MRPLENLFRRVEKLEIRSGSRQGEPLLIHYVFVSPEDVGKPSPEIQRIQLASRSPALEWNRAAGESVEEFTDRALQEAQDAHGAGPVVCLGYSE